MNVYNSRKKPLEDVPEELTVIWACSSESCKGWMRDNFTLSTVPTCPHCKAEMIKSERMLPSLVNTSPLQGKE